VHVTQSASELLFEGYEDNLVSMIKAMPMLAEGDAPPFDRVGFFYMRNNSAELTGYYNVETGANDVRNTGMMRNWNFKNHTPFFEGDCGVVNGSGGEFYSQKLTEESKLLMFSPDMCRSIAFDFTEEVNIHGIKALKYSSGERAVDNGTMFPETACFSPGIAVPSGVLNISACRYGAPVFMSFPHFYKADPYYVNQVDGMQPDKDKHEFYLTLEPVRVGKTFFCFQVNNTFNNFYL
jgi:scavenger receptor class B, member 1